MRRQNSPHNTPQWLDVAYLWSLRHLLQPMQIRTDLRSSFMMKMFGIGTDLIVIRLPFIEVADQQVMLSSPGRTESNQVIRIKFQFGMKVKWLNMMHLHVATFIATHNTCRLVAQMLFRHCR